MEREPLTFANVWEDARLAIWTTLLRRGKIVILLAFGVDVGSCPSTGARLDPGETKVLRPDKQDQSQQICVEAVGQMGTRLTRLDTFGTVGSVTPST